MEKNRGINSLSLSLSLSLSVSTPLPPLSLSLSLGYMPKIMIVICINLLGELGGDIVRM